MQPSECLTPSSTSPGRLLQKPRFGRRSKPDSCRLYFWKRTPKTKYGAKTPQKVTSKNTSPHCICGGIPPSQSARQPWCEYVPFSDCSHFFSAALHTYACSEHENKYWFWAKDPPHVMLWSLWHGVTHPPHLLLWQNAGGLGLLSVSPGMDGAGAGDIDGGCTDFIRVWFCACSRDAVGHVFPTGTLPAPIPQ